MTLMDAGLSAISKCRQCGSADLEDLGACPSGRIFAGQTLASPWPGGRLYRCARCELVFKHPLRPEADFQRMYGSSSQDVWITKKVRYDQLRVIELIKKRVKSGTVLDLGCYDGALLRDLGNGYQRFGIEASRAAAEVASQSKIDILGNDIADLAAMDMRFDVICAVDVIEHLRDPFSFLKAVADKLAPGGMVVLSTGNAACPSWRAIGSRFWYGALPEHISFISPEWARLAAAQLGLRVSELHVFRHADLTQGTAYRLKHGSRLALKTVVAALESVLLMPFSKDRQRLGPTLSLGVPGLFVDHVLVAFTKI